MVKNEPINSVTYNLLFFYVEHQNPPKFCDFLRLWLRNTDFDFNFYFFHFDLRFLIQIYKENKINVSRLADLSPIFLKSPLIAHPLTAMASKKVR
jgi:hypothetical protein